MEAVQDSGVGARKLTAVWLAGSLGVWAICVFFTGAFMLSGQLRQAESRFAADAGGIHRYVELRLRALEDLARALAVLVTAAGDQDRRLLERHADALLDEVPDVRQAFLMSLPAAGDSAAPAVPDAVVSLRADGPLGFGAAAIGMLVRAAAEAAQRAGLAASQLTTLANGRPGYYLVYPLPAVADAESRFMVVEVELSSLLPAVAAAPTGLTAVLASPTDASGGMAAAVDRTGAVDGLASLFPSLRLTSEVVGSAPPLRLTSYRRLDWSLIDPEAATAFLVAAAAGLVAAYRHGLRRARREWVRRNAEIRLYHMANYDSLTGLPNRNLFKDRLQRALVRAQRYRSSVALCFIDLDGFKAVNDTAGHDAGDRLLQLVAERLTGAVRAHDTVARLSGDEFVVVLEDIHSKPDAERVVAKIRDTFSEAFVIGEFQFLLTASIGLAVYPEDGRDPAQLLGRADARMYAVKYPEWVADATPAWMAAQHDDGAAPERTRRSA